ncbi:MAG TPA: carboxypeptidase regulatory-like domain-containing protein [Edaphobacter sp.]|nr:carboxypeptidase regulatory-like domain-containing protein [Edaphobacter sp.]
MLNYVRAARLWLVAAVVCFLLTGPRGVRAQAVYGSLYGTVTDTSGAVVKDATVTVTNAGKGITQTAQTNESGAWTVTHLIPDTYDVKVEAPTFTATESKGIIVHADASQLVDIQLGVGATTTVNVSANEIPALKTDRADVSQILDERAVQNLPNLNRNFTQFTLLTPGVQHSTFNINGPENPQGTTSVTTNGSSYGVQGWLLDGTDNREPVLGIIVINPTLDSVGEMKVTSSNYDAEFGGAVGGIVSAQTKSGGNQFHGDAFFYRRSGEQLARNPFTQSTPDPVTGRYIPGQVFGQFGGSLSGPIIKDRTFFFMDYQGTRQRLGASQLLSVPTLQARSTCIDQNSGTACDLSQYLGAQPVYNHPTGAGGPGQQYASNAIPRSAITPQAINLLKLLPAPNTNGTAIANNYAASGNGSSDADQADIRLDHQVTGKIHAFGRYDYAIFRLFGNSAFGPGGGPGFGIGGTTGRSTVQNQSAALGMDWAVSPTLLTDVRFGFLSYHVSENKLTAGQTPAQNAGIPNLNTAPDSSGLPNFTMTDTISNFGNQGCNCPLLESEQVFQLANNWTKILGNHTIKFGGDIRYALNLRNASDNDRAGVLNFASASTAAGPLDPVASSGNALASLLFGQVARFQRFDVYSQDASNRQKRGAFYAQDSWRVTNKLQINYGLRWDIIFPETVNSPANGGFADINAGGIRVAGVSGTGTNGGQEMDFQNLAGRFGFAYQLHPNTVIRGGFGQVYDSVGFFGTLFGSVLTHNLPVLNNEDQGSTSTTGGYYATLTTLPAKPAAPTVPANGIIPFSNNVSPQFRGSRIQLPKVDQWNLTIQQQFSNSLTAEVAYVGNHAERIYPGETYGFDFNAPTLPTSPSQLGNVAARRPYFNKFTGVYQGVPTICCSNGLTSAAPAANANYHALQTKLEKRFSNGLQFNANYTWSKAMNYANDAVFANYPNLSYGRNDTNRTNVFVMSGLYTLPFGRNRMFASDVNRVVDYAIGGWTLTGSTIWESGRPFTPTYGECGADQDLDNNFGGPGVTSDCRPNGNGGSFPTAVGSLNPVTHSRQYFTPVAALTPGGTSGVFSRPAFGTIGNIGRNSLVGPRDYYADAALIKDIPITERVKAQFQFQAFNIFNHAALDIPTASNARCIDCTTGGGVITSLEGNSSMRQLQFVGRITF